MEKMGVFLCTGCEIAEAVDVAGFEALCGENGAQRYATHPCLCSAEGLSAIRAAVEGGEIDGVLIAACSPRAKATEFAFDRTKVAVERVDLREQVAWSHEHGHEDTQMLAEDQLRMGLARLKRVKLVTPLVETIARTVLTVGGGRTGMQAALAAADLGSPVLLVETGTRLGGYLADVRYLVPERPPYDRIVPNDIREMAARVQAHPGITVHLSTGVERIDGQPGQFEVALRGPGGATTVKVGAIIQATGAAPYDAARLAGLGYGVSPNVITTLELEKMLNEGALQRPSDGKRPDRVAFVQCAGSRDEGHLPYCSSECCATSMKLAAAIHRDHGDVECAIVYRDLRAPGQLERFYKAVQEQPGSLFTRGVVTGVSGNGTGPLTLTVRESLLGDEVKLHADLVVLATGMVPRSADGEAIRAYVDAKRRAEHGDSEKVRKDAAALAEKLKDHAGTEILNLSYRQGPDLPVLQHGFPDSHYICFPYETRRTGIYAAGAVHSPMDAAQATEDAWGAAMKAVQCLAANSRGEAVHPRSGDLSIATFALQRCTQCKRCTEECPFGTINEDAKGTPEYNPLRCRRCGICLGACPERIISFPEYSIDAVASMIKAVEVPDADDEKPRILAFMCENDALPALEEAARRRLTWNAWMRIIPARCLGAVNTVWVADSLSTGFDGVLLLGCQKGDDYQCHYVKGSELAARRMSNVQETLDRLALEAERLQVVEVARDDWAKIPTIFAEFAKNIEDVGPNPYKGF
ncbi:MAG: hydrogenase iron-sulfur subunit [Planctomycetota bacterium]